MSDKKPSEKAVSSVFDGKEITDELGRKIRLKKPDLLDIYDLNSCLGEDSKSAFCQGIAMNTLYIATIDNQVIQAPKSYSEFRINLKRIKEEGLTALMKFIKDNVDFDNEREEDKLKKL